MKTLSLLLLLILSTHIYADCRPDYEADIAQRLKGHKKTNTIGKYSTGATFVTVGAYWGYMGVVLLGPLWAGVVVGSSFGAIAALPVGATFVAISQVQRVKLKNRIRGLNIISDALQSNDEIHDLEKLHQELQKTHPEYTLEEVAFKVRQYNDSGALCDGRLTGGKRKLAVPKDLLKHLKKPTSLLN